MWGLWYVYFSLVYNYEVIIMKKDTYNKPTIIIDRKNWAQKVLYRCNELTNKAIHKRKNEV